MDLKPLISTLRRELIGVVRKNPVDGLLLSGGIDSGILSYLLPHKKAITVSLEGRGEDLIYVSILDKAVGLDATKVTIGVEDALKAVREVIFILKSFDPALPNDLAVYFGMREAKRQRFSSVMTGDGADELFGGYPYMQEIEDLDTYTLSMSRSMHFSSNRIGNYFDIDVKQPYLDEDFIALALTVTKDLKIREEKGTVWGKWILRKAFEPFLPSQFIWQQKRPLEVGSGMNLLRAVIAEKIPDTEFEEKKRAYPVKFICKEHLFFYELYLQEVGEIPLPQGEEIGCPGCGAGMSKGVRHCRICGWVS